MALEEKDLKAIKKIVRDEVQTSAEETKKVLRQEIQSSAEETKKEITATLRQEIKSSAEETKKEIISVLTREITDQAEINRAMMTRSDAKDQELDKRVTRIERRLGLVSPR